MFFNNSRQKVKVGADSDLDSKIQDGSFDFTMFVMPAPLIHTYENWDRYRKTKMDEIKDRIIVNPLHNKQGTNSNHTHTQYWMC
jgi:hypothetical protein